MRGIPSAAVWPEYDLHGDVLNQWWGHLDEELPDFQFVAFPESDQYVFPEGLAPVRIDRAADRGFCWGPNVWMVHPDLAAG